MAVPAMVPFTVFSAHAEVVPKSSWFKVEMVGILRARGGSSMSILLSFFVPLYSPRTRR